jgi:hypothetical protein
MSLIKSKEILQNDVLMGLLGKACHCPEHGPFDHFGITPDSEVEIQLLINGKELPGAAGFLQAYYRQYEKLVASRVRNVLDGDLNGLREAVRKLTNAAEGKFAELFPQKEGSENEGDESTV